MFTFHQILRVKKNRILLSGHRKTKYVYFHRDIILVILWILYTNRLMIFITNSYDEFYGSILFHIYLITSKIRIIEMSHKRNHCAHQKCLPKKFNQIRYICTNAVCFVCMHSSLKINICVCITTNIFKASLSYHIRIYI